MSFATGGEYDDLEQTVRRPISVSQLLEREGYRAKARSSAARRTLTGVAAGAVLSLGAVVGSLLLNHGSDHPSDALASGAGGLGQTGGDVVVAETSGASSATTTNSTTAPQPAPAVQNAAQTSPIAHNNTNRTLPRGNTATTPGSTSRTTTSAPATSTTSAAPSTTGTSTTTPTTGSTPTSSSTAPTTGSSTPTAGSSTSPSTGSNGGGNNGGLLGAVTGTVSGVLGSVTQPVFNWFG